MKEFKVGDVVWYLYGHHLGVKCTITKIDDEFRKKNPDAYLFYEIDEPVGHSLDFDDLFLNREQAEQELLKRYKCAVNQENTNFPMDLNAFRTRRISFIVSTWEDLNLEEKANKINELFKTYKIKTREEWFNLKDV